MRTRIALTLIATTLLAGVVAAVTLNSGRAGTAVSTARYEIESCAGLSGPAETACFSDAVVAAYQGDSLEAAAALMEYASTAPGRLGERFAARCHEAAHALGLVTRVAVESDLDRRAPARCRSGFFHGIHYQRFAVHKEPESLRAAVSTVCAGSESLLSVGRGGVGNGCRHALGHELLLRGIEPTDAARACMLPVVATHNPESAVDDCLRGLYMEVFLTFEAEGAYQDPAVVCAPARELSLAAGLACIGESGLSLFRLGESVGPAAAFRSCAVYGTQDPALAASCAGGLGRSAAAFLANDRVDIEQYCRQGGELFDPCLVDAAAAVMEAEQDYSWASVCTLVVRVEICNEKMEDIKQLVETRS